jgi:uncharacterized iron-regulated membrane protein
MRVRRVVLLSHRWMGLPTSVFLAVAGLTGVVMMWFEGGVLRRIAGRLHESLGLGTAGHYIMFLVSTAAVLIEIGGIVLWWKRKQMAVRITTRWQNTLSDIHHPSGILLVVPMILLASTAAGMFLMGGRDFPYLAFRRTIVELHGGGQYGLPVKLVYTAASLAFALQGMSGVVMWWEQRRRRR